MKGESILGILAELEALEKYASEVRCDWSHFDGRDMRDKVYKHTKKIKEILKSE